MPTLQWIGKDEVAKHNPAYHTLEKKYTFNAENSDNMIIKGDNLLALKSLLPKYENKIKCIYIDPPYNTGNENWVYNDNVNSKTIKKWLNKVVDKDDLSKHDKWLCMMYPRLKLLHKLLADDGVMFISIDDNEMASLKLLCDEIFGVGNFVTNFIWEKKKKPAFLSRQVGSITEYILSYAKNINILEAFTSSENKTTIGKKYPLNNAGNGIKILEFPANSVTFGSENSVIQAQDMSDGNIITELLDEVIIENYKNKNSFRLKGEWRYSQIKLNQILNNDEKIVISKIPFRPNHIKEGGEDKKIHNFLSYRTYNIQTNEDASSNIQTIFNNKVFDFSKPYNLIEFLLDISTDKNSIILDSFAGSGTTAHAVLELNKKDGGNRKFILVEMEDYAENTTAERVRRVIKGYGKEPESSATGGDFSFYEIGDELLLENGNINENVSIEKIREYIYFSETKQEITENSSDFLGECNDTAYYFYYKKGEVTTLDYEYLSKLKKASSYVIYADRCTLSKDTMLKYNVTFKKIPRDIKKV